MRTEPARASRGEPYRGELLETKLIPPSSARRLIDRPRLTTTATALDRVKVALVRAPAGFGKTSLLAQWYHALGGAGRRVAWLSFDVADRDAIEVLAYVGAAFETAGHVFSVEIRERLRTPGFATADGLVAALINDLCNDRRSLFLFLDDVHALGSADAAAALGTFIERMPQHVHVVLASREGAPFPLGRARACGDVVDVTASDLRFTSAETAAFMHGALGRTLDRADIALVDDRLEGWVAGLKLAAIALENDVAPGEIAERISGRRWTYADFFAEVVLRQLSTELVDFLVTTSLLDRFCPALCDALGALGPARELIDEIERRGLFLFSLDGERRWYRYHHLFVDYLREEFARRSPGAAQALYGRASRWFLASGMSNDAFSYAIKAGDLVAAAAILSDRCHAMFFDGELRGLMEAASLLPHDVLIRFPRIALAKAWSLVLQWHFDEARLLLAAVKKTIAAPTNDAREEQTLLHLHCTMMLAQFEDDMVAVERYCETLIDRYLDADPYLVGNYFTSLLYAQREQYKLDNVDRLDARARECYRRAGSRFVLVWHQSIVGPTRFLEGDTDAAIEALEDGLDAATTIAGSDSSLAAIPALLLAEVRYERNELGASRSLLEHHLSVSTGLGFVDQLAAGFITQARLERLHGDDERALATLDHAMDVADVRGFDRLAVHVTSERIAVSLQRGDLAEAQAIASRHLLPRTAESVIPGSTTTTIDEVRAFAWVALAQAEARTADALRVTKAWLRYTEARRARRSELRWSTVLARLLLARGERLAAERAMLRAVSIAAPGRYIRTFLDLGDVVPDLLGPAFAAHSATPSHVDTFIRELLALFARSSRADVRDERVVPQAAEPESFTSREIEIMRLVAAGLSNRTIAQRLAMTEGTVKWYLHRAYDRVGVRNRTQMVEVARRTGVIS